MLWTCPPALPGQSAMPELTLWEGMSVLTVVSAHGPLLPIPRPGNGHSKEAKKPGVGPGRCRPVLLEHHLPLAGRATGLELLSRAQPWLLQPQVIRASSPLYTRGRALVEPWSRGAPAN